MQDVLDREVSPTSSDLEYMSMISDDHYEHPNFDIEPEGATIVGSNTINDNIIDHGKRVGRLQDIGEAIFLAYPHPSKYEDDEEGNMFDDGLEDDQSDAGSEASTSYEELTDPEVMPVVLRVPQSDVEDSDEDESNDLDDDEYDQSDEDSEGDESGTVAEEPAVEPVLGGDGQGLGLPLIITHGPTEIPQSPKKTFAELQEQRYKLLYQEYWGPHKISLERGCDNIRWKLLELEEMKKRIDKDIASYEECLGNAEKKKTAAEDKVEALFEYSGISMELYTAYEAFCESLDPQYGQREGFSITCNADHDGSYVMYDPEFDVFKTCIEMPYTNCNFRSEAWTPTVCESEGLPLSSKIVEFWPIKSPIPNTGTEATWGEQYVCPPSKAPYDDSLPDHCLRYFHLNLYVLTFNSRSYTI
jgi:hypothetical protein